MLELTLRLVASLAVVVGLLMLLARFGGRRFRGRAGDLVRIVHRQPLTRGSSVAVVTVGSRVLVLGTTEQQVTILTELDPHDLELSLADPAEVTPLALAPAEVGPRTDGPRTDGPRAVTPRPVGAHRADVPTQQGALTGSVLSPQTWRQALAAATGRAS